ncbi:NAD(P)H dehydrogenase assembly family protein, partial [Synechococcus sp. R55.3]
MSEAQGLLPVGATVQVVEMPPYLKTADPMP